MLAFACLLFTGDCAWATDDFIGFLLARNLVVEGELISSTMVVSHPAGSSPLHTTECRVRVIQSVFGTAEDTTISLVSLGQVFAKPGARVIGFANRLQESEFRLWGGVAEIKEVPNHPWSVDETIFDSLATRSSESGFTAFNGADGVAMIRLRAWSKDATGRYSYSCDSLGWVIPTSARVPNTIDFAISGECSPFTAPGDTLLIPLVRGVTDTALTARGCLGSWKVTNGFLPGFGVPLAEFDLAIDHTDGRLSVRPILKHR